jgi:hypothetical protein
MEPANENDVEQTEEANEAGEEDEGVQNGLDDSSEEEEEGSEEERAVREGKYFNPAQLVFRKCAQLTS